MPVTSYSRTPANNNSAAPNGAPEGWAPSAVNDTIRQIMTDIVNEAISNSCKVLASVAGTDTITATATPDLTAYSTGMLLFFTPANNNTAASTVNVDALGAKSIVKGDGTALMAGDLQASTIHSIMYDGTNFVLLNPVASTARYDAATSNFTGTLQYGGIEVGYRGLSRRDVTTTDSTAATDAGKAIRFTGANTFTFTLDADTATDSLVTLVNVKSGGTLTIAASTALNWFNGAGFPTGSITLAAGGIATVWHLGSGNYYIWGTGIS